MAMSLQSCLRVRLAFLRSETMPCVHRVSIMEFKSWQLPRSMGLRSGRCRQQPRHDQLLGLRFVPAASLLYPGACWSLYFFSPNIARWCFAEPPKWLDFGSCAWQLPDVDALHIYVEGSSLAETVLTQVCAVLSWHEKFCSLVCEAMCSHACMQEATFGQ